MSAPNPELKFRLLWPYDSIATTTRQSRAPLDDQCVQPSPLSGDTLRASRPTS